MADSCDRGAATESDERGVPDLAAGDHQVLLRTKAKQSAKSDDSSQSHVHAHPFVAVRRRAIPRYPNGRPRRPGTFHVFVILSTNSASKSGGRPK